MERGFEGIKIARIWRGLGVCESDTVASRHASTTGAGARKSDEGRFWRSHLLWEAGCRADERYATHNAEKRGGLLVYMSFLRDNRSPC